MKIIEKQHEDVRLVTSAELRAMSTVTTSVDHLHATDAEGTEVCVKNRYGPTGGPGCFEPSKRPLAAGIRIHQGI